MLEKRKEVSGSHYLEREKKQDAQGPEGFTCRDRSNPSGNTGG